jgi:hypothetical protein
MTSDVRYLVDTSAILQLGHEDVATVLEPLLTAGHLATCGVIDLKLYAMIRSSGDLAHVRAIRAASFQWLATNDEDFLRALQVHAELAEQGQHDVGWPELVVAAVALRHGVTVLHCNGDFERIAGVTGQRVVGRRCRLL